MKPVSINEQLAREKRREAYEQQRLIGYASLKAMNLSEATTKQLFQARLLADHPDWELSKVGRAAVRELKKRGLG